MARTILESWNILNVNVPGVFSNPSASLLRIFEFRTGMAADFSGPAGVGIDHSFGQHVIDAWAAINQKMKSDESVETISLKNFKNNNL